MLPPWRSGGIVERGPVSGATPTSPQNGASGTRMPGQNSTRSAAASSRVIFRWPSGKSSASRPKPAIDAVQPQSAGVKSSSSTWSVSPGSAPATSIGPLTWSTPSKSSSARLSVVESAVIWPFDASRQSNATTSPEPMDAMGGMAGSHARWCCSRVTCRGGDALLIVSTLRDGGSALFDLDLLVRPALGSRRLLLVESGDPLVEVDACREQLLSACCPQVLASLLREQRVDHCPEGGLGSGAALAHGRAPGGALLQLGDACLQLGRAIGGWLIGHAWVSCERAGVPKRILSVPSSKRAPSVGASTRMRGRTSVRRQVPRSMTSSSP